MPDKKISESAFSSGSWKGKVINHNQLGGIETSILDNGAGKGSRIAWINTGTGFRFKVLPDRGLDIAEAFFNEHSLAWISHLGTSSPNPAANTGINWLSNFGGGLLTTCGLTHVGGPEKDEFGDRGVHDRISNLPASIESVIQPDLLSGRMEMSISGTILQSTVFGPHLLLKRTISARLGHPGFTIRDEVSNPGNTPAPHMILYHFNFGWPLVDEGSEMNWEGKMISRGGEKDNQIFNSGSDFKKCKAPLESHLDNGEAVGFIIPNADDEGRSTCSLRNNKIRLNASLSFKKDQLPWLINWQHWGKNEYVAALEPASNPPIGQSAARKDKTLVFINPGETKVYEIDFLVTVI